MASTEKNFARCLKAAEPIIKQRLNMAQQHKVAGTPDDTHVRGLDPKMWSILLISAKQNDALQWIIEEGLESDDPANLEVEIICRQVLALNMVAIHTTRIVTSFTVRISKLFLTWLILQAITNTFLDLFHSPDAADFVSGLRDECKRVSNAHNGQWTKAALNGLVLVDSAIRESMRLSVHVVGMHRMASRSTVFHS